ncbi:DUF6049 family protein [Actinomadura hibisca]|uniref:DUF6049 family protein n=1 Tax=Actinomadura hibisca TaxID=68565 RepID=UPI0012FC6D92|nr:DUF6049 family protein [Actinomadura hibisca]
MTPRTAAAAATTVAVPGTSVAALAVPDTTVDAALAAAPDVALPDEPATAAAPHRDRQQVALSLTYMSAKADPKSKITVRGVVQNRSGQALPGLSVRLRYNGTPVSSRGELDQYAAAPPGNLNGQPPNAVWQLPQTAAANGRQTFSLSVDTAVMGLERYGFGVYPVGVEVVDGSGQALAGVTSFVTYVPKQNSFKPVQVSWVWPLVDRMHRADDRTFTDDKLATDMAAGGRLRGLVDAAQSTRTPVTWAIDPALLDDVTTMTAAGGYNVQEQRPRKTVHKQKSQTAVDWLKSLREASKGDPYFTLPYADPDVMALVRYKQIGPLNQSYAHTGVAADVLGRKPTTQIAWPPSGLAGYGTLGQLARLNLKGGGSFLLSDTMFEPQNVTTVARTNVQTGLGVKPVLAYDQKLSTIVSQSSAKSPGGELLAQQRFLAETAMITMESPNAQRTVVVAPNRHWNPSPKQAQMLLDYTQKAPWLAEKPLAAVGATAAQPRVYRGYPDEYQRFELGDRYLDQVYAIGHRARGFAAIMVAPITMSYDRAVLRLQSAAWRGRPGPAQRARQELALELKERMDKIRLLSKSAPLAGGSGRLLLTLANDLPDQKVRFRLRVSAEYPAKLKVGELQAKDEVIELGPDQKETPRVPVQAMGNGSFRLHVELLTVDDGKKYGDTQVITVRTTGYGRVAVLITGGGLAVLFVGVGVRAIRARRRREAEAAGVGSGMEPAAAGAMGPGTPGAGSAGFWPTGQPTGPASPGPAPGEPAGTSPGTPAGTAPAAPPGATPVAVPGPADGSAPDASAAEGPDAGAAPVPGDPADRAGGEYRGGNSG